MSNRTLKKRLTGLDPDAADWTARAYAGLDADVAGALRLLEVATRIGEPDDELERLLLSLAAVVNRASRVQRDHVASALVVLARWDDMRHDEARRRAS